MNDESRKEEILINVTPSEVRAALLETRDRIALPASREPGAVRMTTAGPGARPNLQG